MRPCGKPGATPSDALIDENRVSRRKEWRPTRLDHLFLLFLPPASCHWWRSAASTFVRAARQAGMIVAMLTPPSTTANARANELTSVALTP
jgi:hypothetical protein